MTGYNRRNAQTHEEDTPVRVGSPAEILNLYAKMVTTTFFAEAIAALTVRIFGGYADINGEVWLASNKEIVLEDNTTTYIWLQYFDKSIQYSTSSDGITDRDDPRYGQLLHVVSTSLGNITGIESRTTRHFNSQNQE